MTRTIDERIDAATSDITYEHRLDIAQIRDVRLNEKLHSAAAEFIEEWLDEESCRSADEVREVIRRHFAEPWLDMPDGTGWWWLNCPPSPHPKVMLVTEHYDELYGEGGVGVSFWDDSKWQRVIGPSN